MATQPPERRLTTETALNAAMEQARQYTDVSFEASGPGGATDEQVDAAVERAVLAGRIVTATSTTPGVITLTF